MYFVYPSKSFVIFSEANVCPSLNVAAKASWKRALTLVLGDPVKAWKVLKNHCFCRNILLEVKMNMKHVDITIRRIANHCFLIYLFIWNSHSRCTNIWKLSPLRCLKKKSGRVGEIPGVYVRMCALMSQWSIRPSEAIWSKSYPPPSLYHFRPTKMCGREWGPRLLFSH